MVRILGRAVVVVVVSILATLATAVSPESALAQTQTPYQSLRAGNLTYLDDYYGKILHDSERSQGWHSTVNANASNASKNTLYKQATKARVAARLLPTMSFATRVGLVGTAGFLGWTIYQHFASGAVHNTDIWLDGDSLGANSLFNPCAAPPGVNCPPTMDWDSTANADDLGDGLSFYGSKKYTVGAAWMLAQSSANSNGGCMTSISGVNPPCWVLNLNPEGYRGLAEARNWTGTANACGAGAPGGVSAQFSQCWVLWSQADALGQLNAVYPNLSQAGWNSQWPRQLGYAVEQTANAALANTPGATQVLTGSYAVTGGTVWRRAIILTTGAMQGLLTDPLDDPAGTPGDTYNYTVPSPYTNSASTGSATDTQESLDEFESPCGQAFINWVLEPGSYSFNPNSCGGWNVVPTFALVQPLVNETYTDYLDRLRDLGWLGSATSTLATEAEALPQMGPEGVVRVRIGQNTYRPTSWPSVAPRWNVDVNLQLLYNPADLPEAPGSGEPLPPGGGDGTGTGVPVPPGGPLGDWCEACPPVDFSPLTEAALGDSFPFGVVPWLGEYVGSLTTAADAPAFTFSFDHIGVSEDYVVDLNVADSYMALIRTILSWCIWIGGVWWFGSRLLGFRETGDPGSAVDEAW